MILPHSTWVIHNERIWCGFCALGWYFTPLTNFRQVSINFTSVEMLKKQMTSTIVSNGIRDCLKNCNNRSNSMLHLHSRARPKFLWIGPDPKARFKFFRISQKFECFELWNESKISCSNLVSFCFAYWILNKLSSFFKIKLQSQGAKLVTYIV